MLKGEVAMLVDEEKQAGEYQVKFDGNKLSSGVHIYRLQARDYVETRKLILIK